jgi:hydroxyacylglutathione hydrolase
MCYYFSMSVRWIPGESFLGNGFVAGNVLVDAGVSPMAVERFSGQIEYIVLTHCHYDHIAYVKEIAHMCNAKVAIHRLDAPGLVDDRESLAFNFGGRSPGILPELLLEEGDRVGGFLVLHTPGHTPGSICLYSEEERDLISGDTVFTDGGFGRFDFPGGSRAALMKSLDRLAGLDVRGLYPGHGSPVEEGGDRHIAAARDLLKSCYD